MSTYLQFFSSLSTTSTSRLIMDVFFQGRQKRETMGLKTTDTTDVFLPKSEGIILVSVNIFIFNLKQNVNNYFHVNIFWFITWSLAREDPHTHILKIKTKVLGIESNFFEFINIIFVTLANLKVVLYFFHTFPWHFIIFKKS